ncbi:MAG TPA: sigma 54-interacting transcriptional regulator [Puia sp.]|jgi:DNA-binding NtrC family response regulator|nr:sigma 54-interacting transcriptional regulator [Puia sp.]
MLTKILIVEDEFVVANDLRMILTKSGYEVCGIADSVDEAEELIQQHQPAVVLLDIHLKGARTGIDLAGILTEKNIAFVYLSANSNKAILEAAKATQPYGFLVKPFREKDILVTLDIARYRQVHSLEAKLRREQELSQSLVRILDGDLSWEERLLKVAGAMQPFIPFDFIILGLKKLDEDPPRVCSFFRTGFDSYQTFRLSDFLSILNITAVEFADMREKAVADGAKIYNGKDFEELCVQVPLKRKLAKKFDLNSNLTIALNMTREGLFLFSFHSRSENGYLPEHLQLLKRLQPTLEITIDRLLAFDEIRKLGKQLNPPKTSTAGVQKAGEAFTNIIGNNHLLLNIFDKVMQVAMLDTSVLLLGESGTGKERFAQSIHELSGRRKKAFVKVNCAALPANLIESELFGHEKGAFTGATDRRIGKFEHAGGGTIFLDEIGDMPMDLQVKLLRVLQEKEIERVGGSQTIPVDVRIVAATNRNLETEIANGKFRIDLYYRLNVFPLTLPPLRNRKDDIPILAQFFAGKFSKKTGKPFHGIASFAMTEMEEYDWPGNIRELENVIEQAFVLNDGESPLQLGRVLKNSNTEKAVSATSLAPAKTLQEIKEKQMISERDHILSILRSTNGRIRGSGGAAEKLQLKPTTLESRMEKLGIKRSFGMNDSE